MSADPAADHGDHRDRPGLRLHQRIPRRGQFRGYRGIDPRTVAGAGRVVGRVFQLCGGVRIWNRRRPDRGQGAGGPAICDALRDPGRAAGRHRLGPADLVLGAAHQFIARTDGRLFGRGHGACGAPERRAAHVRCHPVGRVDEDHYFHFRGAPVGHGPGLRVDDRGALDLPRGPARAPWTSTSASYN